MRKLTKKTESFKLTKEQCPACNYGWLLISNYDKHKECCWTSGCKYSDFKENEQLTFNFK